MRIFFLLAVREFFFELQWMAIWWACVCRLYLGRNGGKYPSVPFFPVSSFLLRLIFKSERLDAVISGESSVFFEKSLWSGSWTALFCSCSDNPMIDFMAISIFDKRTAVSFDIFSIVPRMVLHTFGSFLASRSPSYVLFLVEKTWF